MWKRRQEILRSIRRQSLILLLTLIVCLIPLPVLFITVPLAFIHRKLVQLLAALFRPHDLCRIFTGKGAFFALENVYTRPKLTILLHFIFDGPVPIDKLRRKFQLKLVDEIDDQGNLTYPQLRQTWTQFLGFLFWKWDANFSVDNHVHLYDHTEAKLALSSPCTEDDLKKVTGELLAKPFVMGISPWEAIVIPSYIGKNNNDGREQTVIVFRIHHAMADGFSILKMTFKLFDLEKKARVPKVSFPKLSPYQHVMQTLLFPFKLPFDVAEMLVEAFDGPNAWHPWKKLSRNYEMFFSDCIQVDDVKKIKYKFNVAYNAVVYAVTTGGIRRLMEEVGQKVPESLSCFVPFPMPKHPGGLAVHVSGFFFKLSPRIQSPAERLRQVSDGMKVLKNSPTAPIVFSSALDLVGGMPVWVMRTVYNKLMMTLAMTNFPGPETALDIMDGTKLVDIIPALGHLPGRLGSTAVLVSMAGKQRIVLAVDKKIFEGYKIPTGFAKYINDEVNDLLHSS